MTATVLREAAGAAASARRGLRASSTQGHLVFEAQEKLPPWRCSAEAAPTPAPRPPPTPWQPHAPRRPPAPWPRLPAVPSTTAQPLVHLRGCSVQCFTFSYSPGGCGSWGSSLASVLQGAVAGEGRRHRGPSDLGRGYTTIHALSFEAEEKKRKKRNTCPTCSSPPSTYLLFKGKQYLCASTFSGLTTTQATLRVARS